MTEDKRRRRYKTTRVPCIRLLSEGSAAESDNRALRIGFDPREVWTGWDLNPGLPACKAGDLPLIYRPRRAHSVATQMKLSARIRALSRLNAYPLLGDEGAMGRVAERALRWFVGLSLLAGGLVLLAGAIQFGTLGGPIWVIPLAGVVAAVLAILTGATEGGPRSPILPASAWIVSVLLGILWARLDAAGHAFLSGYAAIVAFGTGIGILRRQLWAWPVALASVVGFGPIVLVLVTQLPTAAVLAGFVLFLGDAVALLAIHRSYFEPR